MAIKLGNPESFADRLTDEQRVAAFDLVDNGDWIESPLSRDTWLRTVDEFRGVVCWQLRLHDGSLSAPDIVTKLEAASRVVYSAGLIEMPVPQFLWNDGVDSEGEESEELVEDESEEDEGEEED